MVRRLTPKEEAFLKANGYCRFATASKDGRPQVTPVIYAIDEGKIIIVTDYGTKKLKNVKENPYVALTIDQVRPTKAVVIEGTCRVYEQGKEYLRLLQILFERFETYRKNPWGEGESPIFKVTPTKIVSWGFA